MIKIFSRQAVMKHIWGILIFWMIGILFSSVSAEAASKMGRAKKAYKNFLSSYKTNPEFSEYAANEYAKDNFTFALSDINADGIPELILRESCADPYVYWIYSYHSGRIKKLKKMDYFSGGMLCDLYPKTHIVYASEGNSYKSDSIYYKLGKGRIKTIARTRGKKCYVNGNRVSKGEYKKYIVRLKKGRKISESKGTLKFRTNNTKNRNQYLK